MPILQMKTHESKQRTPALPVVFLSTVSSHITDHPDGSLLIAQPFAMFKSLSMLYSIFTIIFVL